MKEKNIVDHIHTMDVDMVLKTHQSFAFGPLFYSIIGDF
jgi:hypothetical protein